MVAFVCSLFDDNGILKTGINQYEHCLIVDWSHSDKVSFPDKTPIKISKEELTALKTTLSMFINLSKKYRIVLDIVHDLSSGWIVWLNWDGDFVETSDILGGKERFRLAKSVTLKQINELLKKQKELELSAYSKYRGTEK